MPPHMSAVKSARGFVLRRQRSRDKLGTGSRIVIQARQVAINISHGVAESVRFKRLADFVEGNDLVCASHMT